MYIGQPDIWFEMNKVINIYILNILIFVSLREITIMMNGPRKCKFGDTCRNLQNGNCTYYHSPPKGGGQGNPKTGGGGFRNPNPGGGFKNPNGGFKNPIGGGNPNYGGGNPNYGGGNPNYGGGNPNYGGGNPNYGGGGFGNQNMGGNYGGPKMDEFQSQFCRSFQVGQQCKFGEKCKRKHGFTMDDSLRRLNQDRMVPNHKNSKLTSFESNGKTYFALRMGHKISFFEYDLNKGQFKDTNSSWTLPDLETQYNFYNHNQCYIYFATENKQTKFQDLMFYNIATQKACKVENAHTAKITGILHFSQNVVFSTSLDGNFKVWTYNPQNATLSLDKTSSDKFLAFYSNQQPLPELLFLDITEYNKTKIVSAGTSDGRLLFWIGADMSFQQANFGNKYARIFKVLFNSIQGTPVAMVLAWSNDKSASAILALSLNDFKTAPLIEVQAQVNNPRTNLANMDISGTLLFAGNAYGTVNLYKMPNFKQRVGVIMHQNPVHDILSAEHTTETNIHTRTVFILESMANNKEGSLAVYLNRN